MSKAITYEQATYEMLVEWTRRAMLAEEKLAAAEARIAVLEAALKRLVHEVSFGWDEALHAAHAALGDK